MIVYRNHFISRLKPKPSLHN